MAVFKLNIMDFRLFKIAISFLFVLCISACSGGTDSTVITIDTDETITSATLTLTATDSTGSSFSTLTQGDSATFTISVINTATNSPITSAQVNFTSTSGTLSAPSKLTDDNGLAQITYNSTAAAVGVNTLTVTSAIDDITYTQTLSFNVLDIPETDIVVGYIDSDNLLVEGKILTNSLDENGTTRIDAGSTLRLTLHILDQNLSPITESVLVKFDSNCVQASTATIDAEVFSNNGVVSSTYQDISCATAEGNDDVIVATATINSEEYIANTQISISPEKVGSIEFVSAEPLSIVLKGTGGQGKQESSTLTFLVKSELNNALSQQEVDFSLSSTAGGLSLVSDSGVTNSEGLVTAKVLSGTAPTPIRVTASVTDSNDMTISSQSDFLSVNTGLPDQDSFTLSFSERNPEARNIIGKQVIITAYLADNVNNTVPDGTTVNFTTEGGSIGSSCNTVNGNCSVNWTSQEPYINNHRSTILATVIGHETFVDANGNNVFDDIDGGINTSNLDAVYSGLGRSDNEIASGFIDMPEAWRDDNENNSYDTDEFFVDFNSNEIRDDADLHFNGPQCDSETFCPSPVNNLTLIRKAKVMITSSSSALYKIQSNETDDIYGQNYDSVTIAGTLNIVRGESHSFKVEVSDTQFQTMAVGTNILISATVGELSGTTSHTVPNTIGANSPDDYGGVSFSFSLLNNLNEAEPGTVTLTITSPSGVTTVTSFDVILD